VPQNRISGLPAGKVKSNNALQRQNTEFSKQIFPEKEYQGHGPNFHIHAFVSDLYISTTGLPILLEEICGPLLYYINRSHTVRKMDPILR
jgi:hypothetical protein